MLYHMTSTIAVASLLKRIMSWYSFDVCGVWCMVFRYQSPSLPPPNTAGWTSTSNRASLQNIFDDPQQRYWRNGSQSDRDMYATSTTTSYHRQRGASTSSPMPSSEGNPPNPTQLDLQLTRDTSATKWSSYAPVITSSADSGTSPRPTSGNYLGILGTILKAAKGGMGDSSAGRWPSCLHLSGETVV
jgi:hypothetical protein